MKCNNSNKYSSGVADSKNKIKTAVPSERWYNIHIFLPLSILQGVEQRDM